MSKFEESELAKSKKELQKQAEIEGQISQDDINERIKKELNVYKNCLENEESDSDKTKKKEKKRKDSTESNSSSKSNKDDDSYNESEHKKHHHHNHNHNKLFIEQLMKNLGFDDHDIKKMKERANENNEENNPK